MGGTSQFGANVDSIFNHPLLSQDQNTGGGCGDFAMVGDFQIRVDPNTGNLLPINRAPMPVGDVNLNPDFGKLKSSFTQEGVNNRRTVRLRLRSTF